VRPFIGSEALAAGGLTRHRLAAQYTAVFRDVYFPRGHLMSPAEKAVAAWLWSRRTATVVGLSAAALHGAKWIDRDAPAELVHTSRHRTPGISLRSDLLSDDEVCRIAGIPVTTPARTVFDLGRRGHVLDAAIHVDAVMGATGVTVRAVAALVDRHRGARGLVQLRQLLSTADGGAESPQETRVRLLLADSGLPRPSTQIHVFDQYGCFIARLDMGWERWKVGVEYDGVQHWTDPRQRTRDIDRIAELEALGWKIVRVSADMLRHRPRTVIDRVRAALHGAGWRM
jgi:hypothetical protein